MKTQGRRLTTWPHPLPLPWVCPHCGSVWETLDLAPRCALCGLRKSEA